MLYCALCMHTCAEETTFSVQMTIPLWRGGWVIVIMGLGATLPHNIPACGPEFQKKFVDHKHGRVVEGVREQFNYSVNREI